MRGIFFTFIFLTLTSCVQADSLRLRVGFVLPLSGDLAFLGSGIRDAALLAREDIENEGGHVDLIFEDNQGNLADSAPVGAKLINTDKVQALVSIISGVGSILKPLARRAKILHVGICSDPEVADGEFSFINYLTAEQAVTRYVEQFLGSMGFNKSLAIIQVNEAGFARIVDEMKRQIRADLRIVDVQTFNKGDADFRSLLLRAVRARPDALLLLGLSPEIEMLARQARSLGISAPLTSIEGFETVTTSV